MVAIEDDDLAALHDRVHAASRALGEAYDTRDALAEKISAVETAAARAVRPELLIAFSAAERAVLAAEADMKDAEHASAVAAEAATPLIIKGDRS